MRKSLKWTAASAFVLAGLTVALADHHEKPAPASHVSAKDAKYVEVVPGVSKALLWGDDKKGPYGAFTKFAPGHKNPLHTHSHDTRLVVLEGAYVYRQGDVEKRVGPGEFFSVTGGVAHESAGDEKAGALFYEESPGAFDLKPAH